MKPEPQIQFVYFDVDDTLLDHRHAEKQALNALIARYPTAFDGISPQTVHEAYHRYNVHLWQQYAQGKISKETLRFERFRHFREQFSIPEAVETLIQYYMQAYSNHWKWTQGAKEAFLLIANHWPTGLLTNGFAEVQRAKLQRFPELQQHTRSIVISEEVGVMKPHPDIFTYATEQARVPPENILYVGDSFTSDVQGGQQAGWQIGWFTSSPSTKPLPQVYPFSAWSELLTLLGLTTPNETDTHAFF